MTARDLIDAAGRHPALLASLSLLPPLGALLLGWIALTFAVVLAIRKTFIGILFGASLTTLLALGAGVFALLKWGAYSAFRRRDQPKVRPPALH